MKKFTFKGVLDGFRSSVQAQQRPDQEIQENLRTEHFTLKKTFRHGFPFAPTALAYDPVQRLLAIGDKSGSLRILGRAGVDCHLTHGDACSTVLQVVFLVNEGALITATADDTLHLWNYRQKQPQIVQSLKFSRERVTCLNLALQSKWLYVGSEKGNVHVVHIETFQLSGYVINWNKAIEVQRKTHPGAVIGLCDNPLDANKLLMGFECGLVVLWDLRAKCAELRWQSAEPMTSLSWHYEGKQFMCSHTDGSLSVWNVRAQPKPTTITWPHAKPNKEGKLENCRPIQKVEWKFSKTGEPWVMFSGGLPSDRRTSSLSVQQGRGLTLLEMDSQVVDFITICDTPYTSDMQEPQAMIVLLQNDLVLIDLLRPGFPAFEVPHPLNLHEAAVTACCYLADCPSDLVPAFYSAGRAASGGAAGQARSELSDRDWPCSGGEWAPASCSYSEIIITGHADGSLKFWDASAGTLQVLYKLKTSKVFERTRTPRQDSTGSDPLAIQLISLCAESRKLCVACSCGHVILFKFKKSESTSETVVLEIANITEFPTEETEASPDAEQPVRTSAPESDRKETLQVKTGPQRKAPGFQALLVCLSSGQNVQNTVTALTINSSYGLMAYGTESGLVLIDIVHKVCLMHISVPVLYGSQDPYSRAPRSPKKLDAPNSGQDPPQARSPSIDQMIPQPQQINSLNPSPYPFPCPSIQEATPTPTNQPETELAEDAYVSLTPTPVSQEEVDEEVAAVAPEVTQARRRSAAWKGFNLKRQLSRVDVKIKNTFSAPQQTSQKRGSIFYYNSSPEDEEDTTVGRTTSPETDDGGEISEPNTDPIEGANSPNKRASRPDNLPLFEGKKRSGQENKRDERLLSVPNIKYKSEGKDLRARDPGDSRPAQPSFAGHLMRRFSRVDKMDSSFSRSRSSSMSSLENISCESVQCLAFCDCYLKKDTSNPVPTLWVGTSLGSVLTITLNIPEMESRRTQQASASLAGGGPFRLNGGIISMSFLDCTGALILPPSEPWKDEGKEKRDKTPTRAAKMSPTLGSETLVFNTEQFAILASEKQARVVSLPSQVCTHRQQIADGEFVVKAEVIVLRDLPCLVSYLSSGHLTAHSLPSLRPLIDIDFLPLSELSFQTQCKQGAIVDPMLSIWGQQLIVNEDTDKIARTFCFSNRGHGLYLSSPSELQKFTVCADFCNQLSDMMCELFVATDMPEPPKESFFKGLFGGGPRPLDREELFGETSGKPNRSVARVIQPGSSAALQDLGQRSTSAASEVNRAHMLMVERGDKLSQLEDRSERMHNQAQDFSSSAHNLMLKYKDKKWYHL